MINAIVKNVIVNELVRNPIKWIVDQANEELARIIKVNNPPRIMNRNVNLKIVRIRPGGLKVDVQVFGEMEAQ